MADAKVIPFDDDRSRGGAVQRPPRRRGVGSRRRTTEPALVGEVQPLPGRGSAQDDVPVTPEEQRPEKPQDGGAAAPWTSSALPKTPGRSALFT